MFVEQEEDNRLNFDFYRSDGIHLNERGNEKFAKTIIRKLSSFIPAPLPVTVSPLDETSPELKSAPAVFPTVPS